MRKPSSNPTTAIHMTPRIRRKEYGFTKSKRRVISAGLIGGAPATVLEGEDCKCLFYCVLSLRVAVLHFDLISGVGESFLHLLRYQHGAMLASGAAEADREITLPFADVMRQQIDKQVGDTLDELARLREGHHVFRDLGMRAVVRAQLRDEVRIRQKAHIEDKISIVG